MDRENEKIIFKVEVLDREPEHVDIAIEEIEREEQPIVDIENLDLNQNYLVQGGREIYHRLRGMVMGSEPLEPRDDTYEEHNPYSGPVRRTQLPAYQEDTERYRQETHPVEEQPAFHTPRLVSQVLNRAVEQIPDRDTIREEVYNSVERFKGWMQEMTESFLPSRQQRDDQDKSSPN